MTPCNADSGTPGFVVEAAALPRSLARREGNAGMPSRQGCGVRRRHIYAAAATRRHPPRGGRGLRWASSMRRYRLAACPGARQGDGIVNKIHRRDPP